MKNTVEMKNSVERFKDKVKTFFPKMQQRLKRDKER